MKILIVGLGSIGQRHLRNLKKIYPNEDYFALRVINNQFLIKNKKKTKINLSKYYKIEILKSYNKALLIKPDIVFLCNPSIYHLRDALRFLRVGSNIFIEKPLGGKLKNVTKLIKLNKKLKKNLMIGYQFRFHPLIKKVKEIIDKRKYGSAIKAEFNNLAYLPSFHPYENYRKGYAANRKLGGGVLSTMIHEIDLVAFFFGLPHKIKSSKIRSGIIKSDAYDNLTTNLIYHSRQNVIINLSLTYVKPNRSFYILFNKVILWCDLLKNKIEIYSNKTQKIIFKKISKIDFNQLYIDEIKFFFKCIKTKKRNFLSVENNIKTEHLFHGIQKSK